MAATSNDIANEAIQLIGDNQPAVVGQSPTFDQSAAGKALQKLYVPTVAAVQRAWGWDASRATVSLGAPTANAPPLGYLYEYAYPTNGIEVWQLVPQTIADLNDPRPVNFNVGNAQVLGAQTKVIWTSLQNAQAIYNNNPTEAIWDPLFRQAVVRLLGSALGMALEGRPDSAHELLENYQQFQALGESRAD